MGPGDRCRVVPIQVVPVPYDRIVGLGRFGCLFHVPGTNSQVFWIFRKEQAHRRWWRRTEMRAFRNLVMVIPPMILLSDGIAVALYSCSCFPDFMWFHSEISGHSVLTVLYMSYFSHRFRACAYTWASLVALMSLNVL